ncbi:MAG: GNAT family N-acetyltransferase [Anaerolineae bacterium]|nr:GNAT family N-acetyltransferase [Gloeobacterales cyanobacterium ES-bin-313]
MTIRKATGDDAELLAELGARTFYDAFAAQNNPEDLSAYLEKAYGLQQQAEEIADPRSTFLIAEMNQAAVGYSKLFRGEAPGCIPTQSAVIEIARFYSTQEYVGRGVGPTLMQACLHEAVRSGFQTVWLGVWEKNPRAIAFYRKWGFEPVGSHIFVVGSDPQTDLLMAKDLTKT